MGSTPKYGLHWPDQVTGNDVSAHMQTLAADVEAGLQQAARLVSETFAASGTWTKPVGALWVEVELWGAGAGGSRGGQSYNYAAQGGGGGGEKSTVRIAASRLPATVSVTIGAGGNDGQGATSPTAGGDSIFGVYARARGGQGPVLRVIDVNGGQLYEQGIGGGQQAYSTQYGPLYLPNDYSGASGTAASLYGGGGGGAVSNGGTGVPGATGGGTGVAGDGGGAPGTTASLNGSTGANKTGPSGGGGGGSAATSTDGNTGGNGGNGGTPGGGGGGGAKGGTTNGTGGNGARGEIRVHVICAGK